MSKKSGQTWLAAVLSAGLLLLPFPIAGPVPFWRTFFAWIAFVPLLWAIVAPANMAASHPLLKSTLYAYLTGVLWYVGNCYWIYQTMLYYGGLPPLISAAILALYSLVLGLYFAAFGFCIAYIARVFRTPIAGLLVCPFVWVAVELLSSHLTKVPWDLLGYSQIDNLLLTSLAPITGVYGLSFVLMAGNAWIACGLVAFSTKSRLALLATGLTVALLIENGDRYPVHTPPTQATAVLVQQNVNVNQDNTWAGPEFDERVTQFVKASLRRCGPYLAGMPELDAYLVTPDCPANSALPGIVAWPESPAPFHDKDQRFLAALRNVVSQTHSPLVAGSTALDPHGVSFDMYNSAVFMGSEGNVLGRYDKVHLVPWGEYIPFKDFFSFAKNLTQQAGDMTHGWRRMVFTTGGHSFGVFICYEEIFGDEIRQFVRAGAQVLINISDDGWYGDTCAPWQTLNMARMRAIENRRWLLRDTNTGVTTVIDPYGRLTASIQRHVLSSLAARYGYRSDLTFYTRHGDVFAEACGIISMLMLAQAGIKSFRTRTSGNA